MSENMDLDAEAKVMPMPTFEPTSIACGSCGNEWWDATVVFADRDGWPSVVGWATLVRCHECGTERDLHEQFGIM